MQVQESVQECQGRVNQQAARVKQLKAEGVLGKDALTTEIQILVQLKADLAKLELQLPRSQKFNRDGLEDVLKRRFFYGASFQQYGGVSGLYDYGPTGCALQNNLVAAWRRHFVLEEQMLEVDCSILTPHDVLKTSGHVDRFADLMCKDLKNGEIYRVDHLVHGELQLRLDQDSALASGRTVKKNGVVAQERLSAERRAEYESILAQIDGYGLDGLKKLIADHSILSPAGNAISEPEIFNLMFATEIGPTGQFKGYLRPETAQGQFLNFKRLLEYNNGQMPFASASIGKSFRNEISPRAGLLRVREFTMAEIEHFVHPDAKQHPKFDSVAGLVMNLLPSDIQMQGKSDVVKMSIGQAVQDKVVDNETIGYFMARIHLFLEKIGIDMDRVRFRQHLRNEMAHYAADCWDAEIKISYGWIECVGCADRSAYDLTKHSERTKEKLVAKLTLDAPQQISKKVLNINKKLFGPRFKKEAKDLELHLLTLDEPQLIKLQQDLNVGPVKVKFSTKDGQSEATLTGDLLSLEEIQETVHVLDYTPNVIEPSFGVGRILYSLLEHSWYVREGDDQSRNVFRFPAIVAPTKCLIVPLSSNAQFSPMLKKLNTLLTRQGISSRVDDSAGNIGRRYARNDELGTAFGITVDFQSVNDGTVTLRERDTMVQIRESAETVCQVVSDLCNEHITWQQVLEKYPRFVKQELED